MPFGGRLHTNNGCEWGPGTGDQGSGRNLEPGTGNQEPGQYWPLAIGDYLTGTQANGIRSTEIGGCMASGGGQLNQPPGSLS
jgi:hypothetical protein